MIQSQENTKTDGRTEGWSDPISQDHSGHCQESYKYKCSRMTFKSQRYRVHCQSDQNLFYHSQHGENQLNSKFSLKIKHILEYHELNGHAHF